MCTSTRSPPASRSIVIASSKSRASGGSIVNVSRSRRSALPGSSGSGSVGQLRQLGLDRLRPGDGHALVDQHCSQHGGDVIAPADHARRTRPPRPSRSTATRSPSRAGSGPRRPSVIGRPGSKNGSATSSLPRRATSQTAGGGRPAIGHCPGSTLQRAAEHLVNPGDRRSMTCTSGRMPRLVDALAAGQREHCDRQLQRTAALQRPHRLDGALAEAAGTDDGRPVRPLQGAGNDLGRAGRGAVDQHRHRQVPDRLIVRRVDVQRIVQAVSTHDDAVALEHVGHLDGLIQQPAHVAAQVEDQSGTVVAACALRGLADPLPPLPARSRAAAHRRTGVRGIAST